MSYADYEYIALRRRVEKLERLVALLMEALDLECDEVSEPDIFPVLEDLVQQGRLIEAIKLYRAETGVGLREAKAFVESFRV